MSKAVSLTSDMWTALKYSPGKKKIAAANMILQVMHTIFIAHTLNLMV